MNQYYQQPTKQKFQNEIHFSRMQFLNQNQSGNFNQFNDNYNEQNQQMDEQYYQYENQYDQPPQINIQNPEDLYRPFVNEKIQTFNTFLKTLYIKMQKLDLQQQVISQASQFILRQTQDAFQTYQSEVKQGRIILEMESEEIYRQKFPQISVDQREKYDKELIDYCLSKYTSTAKQVTKTLKNVLLISPLHQKLPIMYLMNEILEKGKLINKTRDILQKGNQEVDYDMNTQYKENNDFFNEFILLLQNERILQNLFEQLSSPNFINQIISEDIFEQQTLKTEQKDYENRWIENKLKKIEMLQQINKIMQEIIKIVGIWNKKKIFEVVKEEPDSPMKDYISESFELKPANSDQIQSENYQNKSDVKKLVDTDQILYDLQNYKLGIQQYIDQQLKLIETPPSTIDILDSIQLTEHDFVIDNDDKVQHVKIPNNIIDLSKYMEEIYKINMQIQHNEELKNEILQSQQFDMLLYDQQEDQNEENQEVQDIQNQIDALNRLKVFYQRRLLVENQTMLEVVQDQFNYNKILLNPNKKIQTNFEQILDSAIVEEQNIVAVNQLNQIQEFQQKCKDLRLKLQI